MTLNGDCTVPSLHTVLPNFKSQGEKLGYLPILHGNRIYSSLRTNIEIREEK